MIFSCKLSHCVNFSYQFDSGHIASLSDIEHNKSFLLGDLIMFVGCWVLIYLQFFNRSFFRFSGSHCVPLLFLQCFCIFLHCCNFPLVLFWFGSFVKFILWAILSSISPVKFCSHFFSCFLYACLILVCQSSCLYHCFFLLPLLLTGGHLTTLPIKENILYISKEI